MKVHRGHKVERKQRFGGITEEKKQATQILTSVNDQLDDDDSDDDEPNKIDIDQIPSDSD